jgi:peptidyl-prolyl cis-trans isomerase A (cyclophilin A)
MAPRSRALACPQLVLVALLLAQVLLQPGQCLPELTPVSEKRSFRSATGPTEAADNEKGPTKAADNDTRRYPDAEYSVVLSIESPKGKSGEVELRVQPKLAPAGARQFWNLVHAGFYDGACFFRVIPGFMAQVGIPPEPKRSEGWEKPIEDDAMGKGSNDRGFVTFATRGPNTRTYQIFFNTVANRFLDHQGFTPFAQVVSGMDVIDALFVTGEGAPQGAGPSQGRLVQKGNEYLKEGWPDVSCIRQAVVPTELPEPTKDSSAPQPAAGVRGDERGANPSATASAAGAAATRYKHAQPGAGMTRDKDDKGGRDDDPEALVFVSAEEQAHASWFSFLVKTFAFLLVCLCVRQAFAKEGSRDLEA